MTTTAVQVERVDIGQGDPLIVVSGLAPHYNMQELLQRLVIVLCNVKPRNMGGARSFALVLAAYSTDGSVVELLQPPPAAVVGERVAFPPLLPLAASSNVAAPLVATKAKPEVQEAALALMRIDEEGVAAFSSAHIVMTTSAGAVTVKTLRVARVR